MAYRTANGDWTDEMSRGPRPIDPDREGDGRNRRAFEGQLVSRMRAQAHQRHAPSAVAANRRADTQRT
jgi:hypothetical protein